MATGDQAEIHQLSQQIAQLLTNTLVADTKVRKTAEESLLNLETSTKLYGLATLYLTRRDDLPNEVHVSSAIAFKNFIKRHWNYNPNDESRDQVDMIETKQRGMIKEHITQFMLDSPSHIQRQLSEAITIIGQSDFPSKWPNLLTELKTSLKNSQDQRYDRVHGILQTAHSIFRRYRYELQSNALWSEIKLVIEEFAEPFTQKFNTIFESSKTAPQDPLVLQQIYKCLLLCCKIYHSLIAQDLPEYFEDQLKQWLPIFLHLLNVQVQLPDDSSIMEDMKSEICEIAGLFVQRYSDAENSKEYTQQFAQNIWNLLITTDQHPRYDTLVSNAIRYLVTVAERPESRSLFQDSNVLNLLCQNVIIPNLTFREIDEELFEDDPEEYVKRDIEGSDVDTRRRAACDLVQALSKFLEAQLIEAFGRYIEEMFKSYESNRVANWRHKDLAIFLYSSMAIKGSTREHGTVSVSQHVDVNKFYQEKIVDELLNESGIQILKADALRYIATFRNHISRETIQSSLPLIVKHIVSSNVVVRTYASITLEKLLTMRDPAQANMTALRPEQLEPYLCELVKLLFDALNMRGSLENDYIMKCIMRLFSFSKSSLLIQFLPVVVPKMTAKLDEVARNPKKPYFNHYLFETLALLIRAACSQENLAIRDEFENVLFSILELVITKDVQEFIPYVLQLLNLILQSQKVGVVSEKFMKLFEECLSPTFWERPANTTPLTDLMHTYIEKISQNIVSHNKLISLLGIFQKLISSKATDQEGMALLQTMMIHIPAADLDARIRDVFMLIFQRLTGSKTTKFVRCTLVCFSLYAYLRGVDRLAAAINQLQDKIFAMVIEKLYIAEVKGIISQPDRRICINGVIKILGHLPLIDNGAYNSLWSPLLLALMQIFELPMENNGDDDFDHFADITETLDFQAKYSRLNFAAKRRVDPTKDVVDLKAALAISLANLSAKLPGFVPSMLQNMDQAVSSCLMAYCQAANVTIA